MAFYLFCSDRVNEMGKELFQLSGNGGLKYCLAPVSNSTLMVCIFIPEWDRILINLKGTHRIIKMTCLAPFMLLWRLTFFSLFFHLSIYLFCPHFHFQFSDIACKWFTIQGGNFAGNRAFQESDATLRGLHNC
jgi:hypothetical protein